MALVQRRPQQPLPPLLSPRPVTPTVRPPQRRPVAPARFSVAPRWLGNVQRWQRITSLMAGSSLLVLLGLYTCTVYTQQQWNRQYKAWKDLERLEKQYELSQESIANALRETARRTQMVPLSPERMIQIPVTTVSPSPAPQGIVPPASPPLVHPIGY